MADNAAPSAHTGIAAFAGETMAKAITTIARGSSLTPFGATRSKDGVADQMQQFAIAKDGALDLAESSEAALQWLEDEASRANICMIVIDGYINDEDDSRTNAIVGRILSLDRQLMVDLALPYEPNEDEEGFSFEQPVFRFSGVAPEGEEIEAVSVDANAFDEAFRDAFMAHAPA